MLVSHSPIRRAEIITPVSALALDQDSTIYVGIGGNVQAHNFSTITEGLSSSDENILQTLPLFETHNVHGLKVYESYATVQSSSLQNNGSKILIAFGDKAVAICGCQGKNGSEVLSKLSRLDDLVLDILVIAQNSKLYLIIGYAHNFLDVFELSASMQPQILRRIHGIWKGCLFSLTLADPRCRTLNEALSVRVAIGTAFGRIDLWEVSNILNCDSNPTSLMSFDKHEGVIFRLVWSDEWNLLASISDDRSVRLWDIDPSIIDGRETDDRQLFEGWGHVSRIWDVAFLPSQTPSSAVRLATASEDGTIKLWLWAGKGSPNSASGCLSTLRGHQADVWRILSIRPSAATNYKALLISGGNDASVKLWDPVSHITASAELTSNLCEKTQNKQLIPAWTGSAAGSSTSSGRINGVGGIHCSPCGSFVVVGLIGGRLWLWRVDRAEWQAIWASDLRISSLHTYFCAAASTGKYDHILIACAHPRGYVTLLCIDAYSGFVSFEKQWQAHDFNTVGLWIQSGSLARNNSTTGFDVRVVSATVDGRCRMWRFCKSTCPNTASIESAFNVQLMLSCQTGGIHEIATSALVVPVSSISENSTSDTILEYLIIGDVRGSISFFISSFSTAASLVDDKSVQPPVQFMHRVHVGESINCLALLPSLMSSVSNHSHMLLSTDVINFLSGGNDSTYVYHSNECSTKVATQTGALADKQASDSSNIRTQSIFPAFYCARTCSALPIRTPMQFFVRPRVAAASNRAANAQLHEADYDLYMSGYFGEAFIIYDVYRSQQILHVDGGSWKRNAACTIFGDTSCGNKMPGAFFVSAVPTDGPSGKTVELHHYHAAPCRTLASASHCGRVLYGVSYFGPQRTGEGRCMSVGGDDGRIKIYNHIQDALIATARYDTTLPLSLAVKCMSSAESWQAQRYSGRTHGVLLGAGNRLTYSLWRWLYADKPESTTGLALVASGSLAAQSSQDHRIMCSYVQALPLGYLIALGDSRGKVSLAFVHEDTVEPSYGMKKNTLTQENIAATGVDSNPGPSVPYHLTIPSLQVHEELDPSNGTPILSCTVCVVDLTTCGIHIPGNVQASASSKHCVTLGVFGASSGEVTMWELGLPTDGAVPHAKTGLSTVRSRLLARYSAHSMGANALDAVCWPIAAANQTSALNLAGSIRVLICSGGDDQALTVACGELSINPTTSSVCGWSVPCQVHRFNGAAGASLEGVCLRRQRQSDSAASECQVAMLTLSADQRVHFWSLKTNFSLCSSAENDVFGLELPVTESRSAYVSSPALSETTERFVQLLWCSGQVTHVGDPQAMVCDAQFRGGAGTEEENVSSCRVAVVGQGIEEFVWHI